MAAPLTATLNEHQLPPPPPAHTAASPSWNLVEASELANPMGLKWSTESILELNKEINYFAVIEPRMFSEIR